MKKAFTLIELLVVIAIIAILAAILFPVFAQAKAAAKKTQDLNNVKQLSLGIIMYSGDADDTMPSAYFHRAFNPASGGVVGGYVHWSGMIQPYVKNLSIFVSPNDDLKGNAPTCFAAAGALGNNRGAGAPGNQAANQCSAGDPRVPGQFVSNGFIVDDQAPRLSYTVNSAVMPRLRNINDQNAGIRVVSQGTLASPSNTILIAGLTDVASCLNGQSITGPSRNSSHRSTNAVMTSTSGGQYLGESSDAGRTTALYAITTAVATRAFTDCRTSPATTYPLMTYHHFDRFSDGDNYGLADGSAKFRPFNQTISQTNFMWGKEIYTDGGRALLGTNGQQVQQN
jgi:prepilin-type N-terminal cleavage/methylation domain-containing protein